MNRIDFDHSQVITPSDDDLDRIAKVDIHAANLLAELYRSQNHSRGEQILVGEKPITKGQISGVRVVYNSFPSVSVKDICLARLPQEAFKLASLRVGMLPFDQSLFKRSISHIADPLIDTNPSVLAAIELISDASNVQIPAAVRIAYPIDYEVQTVGYSPRQAGRNYAKYLLDRYNGIRL